MNGPASGRRILAAQNVSRMCLVCGVENALGLQARFYELEGGELLGVFTPRKEHQSYPGRLHGGVASTMLDETVGRAILLREPGAWGVTAELTVRFRRPVPLEDELRCVARITRDTRRLFEGSGELLLADGTVAVEARGRYLKMSLEEIAADGMDETEWFADPRERPDGAGL
jgi:uncharacterized protein (TIGR00369 family)